MEQTLLLNATYEPLKVVHWQKAITLWCQGKVEIIAVARSRDPCGVVQLQAAVRHPPAALRPHQEEIRLRAVLAGQHLRPGRLQLPVLRDDRIPTQELTFDHVVPVSQGGRKDWENIVTCCVSCNRRKGGRTPEEARHAAGAPAAASRLGAGDSHHDWTAQRARQLARLPLLESRAGRHASTSAPRCSASDPYDEPTRLRLSAVAVAPTRGALHVPGGSAAGDRLTRLDPLRVIEGGRLWLRGSDLPVPTSSRGRCARSAACPARIVFAAADRIAVEVPGRSRRRRAPRSRRRGCRARRCSSTSACRVATGTAPGRQPRHRSRRAASTSPTAASRGQQAPVSMFRVVARRAARAVRHRHRQRHVDGVRTRRTALRVEPLRRIASIASPRTAAHEVIASDLGLACGLAFAPDGTLLVGDRSGTIFHIDGKGRTRDARHAARQRCRVSPRDGSRRLTST